MLKKFFYFLILLSIFLFIYGVFNNYISEKNINFIKSNRFNIDKNINSKMNSLVRLKNDTNNVIEFNSGYNSERNIKIKRKFWNLFNND